MARRPIKTEIEIIDDELAKSLEGDDFGAVLTAVDGLMGSSDDRFKIYSVDSIGRRRQFDPEVLWKRRFLRSYPRYYYDDDRVAIAFELQDIVERKIGKVDLSPDAEEEALSLADQLSSPGDYAFTYGSMIFYYRFLAKHAIEAAPTLVKELRPWEEFQGLVGIPWGFGWLVEITIARVTIDHVSSPIPPKGLDGRERPDQDARLLRMYLTGTWAKRDERRKLALEWGEITGKETSPDLYHKLYFFEKNGKKRIEKAMKRLGIKRPKGRPKKVDPPWLAGSGYME